MHVQVLDPGCMCLTPGCTLAECNGAAWQDPAAPRVFAAMDNTTRLAAYGNMYFRCGGWGFGVGAFGWGLGI